MEINYEDSESEPSDYRPQTENIIRNIPVSFPFTPYKCQLQYMSDVLQALQEKTNAILESPTGTGKTLCLLCSVLAWREQLVYAMKKQKMQMETMPGSCDNGFFQDPTSGEFFDSIPKIVYSSRTHSQLSQAINELKNTKYRPIVSIIGSREQMCINSDVMKKETNAEKIHLCRAKVRAKLCTYYNNLDVKKLPELQAVMDVEDIVSTGTQHRMCPYYLARERMADASLIFMPYNYILDIKMRETHNIDLKNAVVILDEAHNIERVCEDSVSFDLSSVDLAHCIDDVDYMLHERMKEIENASVEDETEVSMNEEIQEIVNLKKMFLVLEEALNNIQLHPEIGNLTRPGCYIFEFLKTAGVIKSTRDTVVQQCEMAITYLTTGGQKVFKSGGYIQKFLTAIKTLFAQDSCRSEMNINYKVYITKDASKTQTNSSNPWQTTSSKNKEVRILRFLCFCPGYAMNNLSEQGVRSIIITSGTLSPLDTFCKELKLEFPIQLEGSHVISSEQVFVAVLKRGCDNQRLNSAYEYRYTDKYLNSLGQTLVNICRVVPDGILVFFPSYPTLNITMTSWKKSMIFDQIELKKKIFTEPKRKADFLTTMEGYYETIRDPSSKGAIFFAVCRGKVSEGLDFADDVGRAVVITGIPFPPRDDPKIKLKMEYFDEVQSALERAEFYGKTKHNPPGSSTKLIKVNDWYRQQAIRAVNQAIGRVIRHKDDYGAILLCDERFSFETNRDQLSKWIKPCAKVHERFGYFQRDLIQFFKNSSTKYKNKLPISKPIIDQKRVPKSIPELQHKPPVIKVPIASLEKLDKANISNPNQSLMDLIKKDELKHSELKPIQPHHVRNPIDLSQYPSSSSSLLNFGSFAMPSTRSNSTKKATEIRKVIIVNPTLKVCNNRAINVVDVKKDLSNESYTKLKTAVTNFKQTKDVKSFFEDLKQVFNRPSLYQSLLGMRKAVPKQQLDTFYQLYSEYTGEFIQEEIPSVFIKKRSIEESSVDDSIQIKKTKQS